MRRQKHLRIFALGLSVFLLLHAAAATTLWTELRLAVTLTKFSYGDSRASLGFRHIAIDDVASRVDRALPADAALALGPNIMQDDFLRQRFTEGLYPRRIDVEAPNTLDITKALDGTEILGKKFFGNDYSVRLTGTTRPATPGEPLHRSYSLSWIGLLLCALGALGFGLATLEMASYPLEPGLRLAASFVVGALVIGLFTSVSTWGQFALPRLFLPLAGLVSLAAVTARHRSALAALARPTWAPRAESWVLAALVLLVFYRLAVSPITMWDGRSIWLFHGHQIFNEGMLSRAAALNPETLWSHPDYPLLLPGWLAAFGGFAENFNERQAALGLAVLISALLTLVWILSRRRLGRWPGAAFTALLALQTTTLNFGAYADGLLLLMLAAATFAFILGLEPLAWLLFAAASLTKAEGLFLALLIALPLLVSRRGLSSIGARHLRPLLVFVPALAHKAWTGFLGIDSLFKGKPLADVANDFFSRLSGALDASPLLFTMPGYTAVRPLVHDGLFCLIVVIGFRFYFRARFPKILLAVALSALLCVLFGFVAIAAMPENIDWFVATSLDRLLAHPATLLTCLPFIYLADLREAHDSKT